MFKSTGEFDAAIRKVLAVLREGFTSVDQLQEQSGLSEEDFHTVLRQSIDAGYVAGLNYHPIVNGVAWSAPDPKLTYSGRAVIESSDRQ